MDIGTNLHVVELAFVGCLWKYGTVITCMSLYVIDCDVSWYLQAFPMRDQHFFASIDKAEKLLGWRPEFGLVDGLKDSYDKDFGLGQCRKEADFEVDDMILEKVGKKVVAMA